MKTAYLFDVDNTLTPPRKKMDNCFTLFFLNWMDGKDIFIVTGSDISKTREQVPHSVSLRCKGIFTCMGNELYLRDELVYRNAFKLDQDILDYLHSVLRDSACPDQFCGTKHYEDRPGMLNFSICGRDVSYEQRQQYEQWDAEVKERENAVNMFNSKFGDRGIEACLGGQISIDIQPKGKDKSQAVRYLQDQKYDNFIYYGDRAYPGGNDYAACKYIVDNEIGHYHYVKNSIETMAILRGQI